LKNKVYFKYTFLRGAYIMYNKPIGIFDSGLGGLTCVKEVIKLLPNEDIIYFGDTSRVPYGTRSKDTIIKYVRQDIKFLQTFDVKMIIVACGTASTVLPEIIGDYDVEISGVVVPASDEAVKLTKNKKIGVLGTIGTINSGKYSEIINSLDDKIEVISQACPLFVPLVENGHLTGELPALAAKEYLQPLIDVNIDTVILGCTHYPLLTNIIQSALGNDVTLVDAGKAAANNAKKYLAELGLQNDADNMGKVRYFVSDDAGGFSKRGGMFLEREITDDVEQINIEEF